VASVFAEYAGCGELLELGIAGLGQAWRIEIDLLTTLLFSRLLPFSISCQACGSLECHNAET